MIFTVEKKKNTQSPTHYFDMDLRAQSGFERIVYFDKLKHKLIENANNDITTESQITIR